MVLLNVVQAIWAVYAAEEKKELVKEFIGKAKGVSKSFALLLDFTS